MINNKVREIVYHGNGYVHPLEGRLPTYSSLGGYPIFYLTDYGNVLCSECANDCKDDDEYETVVDYDANWENPQLYCECGKRIESAYAEDEVE